MFIKLRNHQLILRHRYHDAPADMQYEDVLDMIQKLNNEMGQINRDNVEIRTVCNQLLQDNQTRKQAINDLTGLVKRSLDSPS